MPVSAAERRAYERKLREIERRFGTLERGVLQQSISLLKDLRNSIAGRITQEDDFEQFKIRELMSNIDGMLGGYEAQLRALSNGGISQSYLYGQQSVVDPLRELGLDMLYFQPSPAQVNALTDFTADLIQGLTGDLRRQINREIQLSSLGGKSIQDAMKAITQILFKSDRPPTLRAPVRGIAYEAERILRTEMSRAMNLAVQSTQTDLSNQVPGLRKQWVATGDARTRFTHITAHGQIVGVDEPFIVGASELMYPGDPAGPPQETINCRCRSVTVIPEVEDTSLANDAAIQAELERRGAGQGQNQSIPSILTSGFEIEISSKAKEVLSYEELKIVDQKSHETLIIIQRDSGAKWILQGEAHQVQFGRVEEMLMKNQVITHNHPGGLSFSLPDMLVLTGDNAPLEIRAVATNYKGERVLYRAVQNNISEKITGEEVSDLWNYAHAQTRKEIEPLVFGGQLDLEQANDRFAHEAMERFEKAINAIVGKDDWGLKYERRIGDIW